MQNANFSWNSTTSNRVNKSTNEAAVPHNISQDCEQGEEMRKGRLFFLVHTFLTKFNELRKG